MSAGEADQERAAIEIEVVRLGGSLLLPDEARPPNSALLRTRLSRWTQSRTSFRIWIVGTGVWGDHLRRVQAPLGLSDETCHWAAIGLMSVAGEMAAHQIEGSGIVRTFDELRGEIGQRTRPRDVVFDPAQFLHDVEPTLPGRALPHDWSVTSDSIAARVAVAIGADALVLLKACPAPERRDLHEWSERGLVDGFFRHVAVERMELRWVDLSDEEPAERRYPIE